MPAPISPSLAAAETREWRLALAVLIVATALRLALGAALPLFEDEAYYWEWSRHLAVGYFDHPPLIAALIRAGTVLFGDTPFGVRVAPILVGSSTAFAAMLVARRLAGAGAARRAAVIFAVMPIAAAGLVIATPDAPLLAAVAWALYPTVRALEAPPGSGSSLGWWMTAGAMVGLGLASKYTAVLAPASLGLAMIAHPVLRRRLAEPGPWLALVTAALLFLPVVLWNARHDWVSFAFQLQHGLGPRRGDVVDALQRVGDLIAGQAALASPILFVLMTIAVARSLSRHDPVRFTFAVLSVVPFAFFGYSATRRAVEANWPALIYVPAGVLLATAHATELGRRSFRFGVALAAVLSGVIYLHALVPVVPLRPDRDPIAEAFGWSALADSAMAAAPSASCATTGPRTAFAGNRYQDAAELAFQLARRREAQCTQVFALNVLSRPNQYDLWPGVPETLERGDHLVVVLSGQAGDSAIVAAVAKGFATARAGGGVPLARHGTAHDHRQIWVFEAWQGRR